jgi:hypothetical protein
MTKIALVAAAAALAAAAAILLNLTLLGYAQPRNDPVGRLNPRAALVPGRPTVPAPARHPVTTGEADD